LGSSSPVDLDAFLAGAQLRAGLTTPTLQSWRIFGPLRDPDFSRPLVARTGHPTLTIRWAHALQFFHFRSDDAMAELKGLVHNWFASGKVDATDIVGQVCPGEPDPAGAFWTSFLKRPGMYLGDTNGWTLHCFLQGMARGGAWLGLPELPRLREILVELTSQSFDAYGSEFAAFRVYNAPDLIAWLDRR
jgi:hypothetical protein